MKYQYGNSWEKYPIKHGETWIDKNTGSMVEVCDIIDEAPAYLLDAEVIYCDPPWNLGNLNSFYTKAECNGYKDHFFDFCQPFFKLINRISAPVCYLEIGKQNLSIFHDRLQIIYPIIQLWPITYYKKNECFLLRGGHSFQHFHFDGLDDEETPYMALQNEVCNTVADLCTGQGLTAVAAYKLGKRFLGTELNPRRQ